MEDITFPKARTFSISTIAELHNWILIYDNELDIGTQKAVYENGGMSVSISELITLFEQIKPGKLPLVLNEIGNAYSSIVICGSSKNADRIFGYYSSQYHAEIKRVSPYELEKSIDRDVDVVVIIADLLPDLFKLLGLPKTVYIRWQHIVGNAPMTDEVFDIKERIIPRLIEGGGGTARLYFNSSVIKGQTSL